MLERTMIQIYDILKEPGDANLAWTAVKKLFPGGGAVPFYEGMMHLTTMLMLFGATVISWHVVAGIVESAYTGKVLGNRFHQIWAPVRVILGFGFLVPSGEAGMSGIHYVVKYASIMSINLADGVWSRFVTTIATGATPIVAVSAGGNDAAWQIMESEVCRAVMNAKAELVGQRGRIRPAPEPEGKVVVTGRTLGPGGKLINKEKVVWDWGYECGSISLTMPPPEAVENTTGAASQKSFAEKRREALADIVRIYRQDGAGIVQKYSAHFGGYGTPMRDYEKDGKIVKGYDVDVVRDLAANGSLPRVVDSYIRPRGDEYDAAVSQAASEEAAKQDKDKRQKMVDFADERGFLTAGVYWRALSQISQLTTAYSQERPARVKPASEAWGTLGPEVQAALDAFNAQRKGELATLSMSANDVAWAGDKNSNVMIEIIAKLNRPASEWIVSGKAHEDPIGRMVSMGHYLLIAGESAIVLGIAAAGLSGNVFGDWLGIKDAIVYTLHWANWPIGFTMIAGLFYAYILPILPFVFMIYLGIGWLVKVLEALIAGTLWCLAWIRMDGQELVDTAQRQGAMLLFNLIFVPVLGVLAFCGSYILIPTALNIFGELWGLAALGNQGGNYTGLLGTLTLLFVRLYMELQIVLVILRLITSMHERIAMWYGVPTTSLGEDRDGHQAAAGLLALSHRIPHGRPPKGSGKDDDKSPPDGIERTFTPDQVRARGL